MRRATLALLVFFLVAVVAAFSDVTIKTKDGRSFKVAVEPSDISSIEFTPQVSSSSASSSSTQALAGRWVGTYHNTVEGSGSTILNIVVNGNNISGTLDGDAIQIKQWDGQTLHFEIYAASTKTNYSYQFQLTGEKKAKITYQASSPTRTYSGYVNDFTRQ
jgi:hypothetical protein